MNWSPTDQFGNLNVAASSAIALEDFRPDLASLIEELHLRHKSPGTITIDIEYKELNGPDPANVSHILQAPDLSCFHSDRSPEEIKRTIVEMADLVCNEKGIPRAEILLA